MGQILVAVSVVALLGLAIGIVAIQKLVARQDKESIEIAKERMRIAELRKRNRM